MKTGKLFVKWIVVCLALSLAACGKEISDKEESAAVIYSWDNAKTDAEPKSGTFTGDWNNDGVDDLLKIETEEQEGSEVIKRLELSMSGLDTPYVLENQDNYFIDIISGDFDSDADLEILLLFDMRYAGANGCLGIRVLDLTDFGYVELTEDSFTGFGYFVEVEAGKNGSYVISRDGGEQMTISADDVSESAIGMVTGFYSLDVLKDREDVCRLRIKQYVAGEDMLDHVGDVVNILEVQGGKLKSVSEETIDPKADLSDIPEAGLPVSLEKDMLSFASACGSRQCGDGYLELLCPDGLLACPSTGGGLYFFRDGIYCGSLFHAEFDEPYDQVWKDSPDRCGVGEFGNRQASWEFLYEAERLPCYVYAGERAVYPFGDTEFLQEKGILTADEALEEHADICAALIGQTGDQYGYYLEVSRRVVSEETWELLLRNITVHQEAFASADAGTFKAASVPDSGSELQELPETEYRFFEAAADSCVLTYEMAFRELQVRVPEGMRGLHCGQAQWLIYDNYDNRSELGYARGENLEESMSVEDAVLKYGCVSEADAARAAEEIMREEDGTYTFTCSYEVSVSGEEEGGMLSQSRTRKIWIDREGKYLFLLDLCGWML